MSSFSASCRIRIFRDFYRMIFRCCSSVVPNHQMQTFSGIQPSGSLHLGNYIGAVKQWLKLQEISSGDVCRPLFCIVDLHAITIPQDPSTLRSNILTMAASLLACGIDPDRSILFQQSQVPEHAELAWLLGSITTMARLAHLPQYKEKTASVKEIKLGLFTYPVLQSADILLYKATTVPVGDDQLQHIQLAQQLAKSFNNKFGYCFPIPKAVIGEDLSSIPRLKSLRDVTRKMSKSDPDSKSRIDVTDTPDLVRSKLKKALTDFTSEVSYDPASRPAVSNLIALHSQFSGLSTQQICKESHGLETAEYKMVVADVLIEFLKPIQTRINELLDDRQHLCSLLRKGSTEAREISTKTLTEVKNKMGLN